MSEETKEPIKLSEIAKRKADENTARMAKYNAEVMAGAGKVLTQTQLSRLSELPYTQLIRHSYIRGIFATVESLWNEHQHNIYSIGEVGIENDKRRARERIKTLENAIDLLKLIEGV